MKNFRQWLVTSTASKKRGADWLEKASVAAIAVGVFQFQFIGVAICAVSLFYSFWLTRLIEQEQGEKEC